MTLLSTFTNLVLHIKQKAVKKNISIFDMEENTEIFTNVQYLDGSIDDHLKMMEHPKEDGTQIVDHVIDDVKQANITVIIADSDTASLNEILDYYQKRTPVIIKIKNEIYSQFVMSAKPLKADSSYFDKTVYELSFKEVINAKTVYVKMDVPKVKNKANASKIKTGHKQGSTQSKTSAKPSILRIWTNKITKR